MKILFLCTAHNSLSQRLYVVLSEHHSITIELALNDHVMIEAAILAKPDIIICPYLTVAVPEQIHNQFLTLIIHPGPPGDAGPSSLDWLILGDDNTADPKTTLTEGLPSWGVTVLQATETFDAGPVWAFEEFAVKIDTVTKSTLYRGAVTRAAIAATILALSRIQEMTDSGRISPALKPSPKYRGNYSYVTSTRPLLRAADRDFTLYDPTVLVSRKIRCSDSQPGCLSSVFGPKLYLYGGIIDTETGTPGEIIRVLYDSVLLATSDGSVWITHLRRMKRKEDKHLWPKLPAASLLKHYGLLKPKHVGLRDRRLNQAVNLAPTRSLMPGICLEYWNSEAFIFFNLYNGAMSTDMCSRLMHALDDAVEAAPKTIVLMGGNSLFSNGIHLNVIHAADDPALETWRNINRINDVVFHLLHTLPKRGITSVAVLRGNAAAGGVALAAACDYVLASPEVVLNPSYRAIGLHGSEYHTLSYPGRCGVTMANSMLRGMLPISASNARSIGLVDRVMDTDIRSILSCLPELELTWKNNVDLSLETLQLTREKELAEMAKDCWSPRAERFISRRTAFVCKVKPESTPLRFATHRKMMNPLAMDLEESDDFDSLEFHTKRAKEVVEDEIYETVIQFILSHISKLFVRAIRTETRSEAAETIPTDMIYPCYYQA